MQRPGSSLSRLKQQHQNLNVQVTKKQQEKKIPTKEEFVKNRDFVGAITLLEHEKMLLKDNVQNQLWLAYCYFHNGDYDKALDIYTDLLKKANSDQMLRNYKACCLYALCKYKEAYEEASKAPENDLNVRVKFHCAFKLGNGNAVMENHTKLNRSNVQDLLCLSALQYLKNEYEDATEIYKKIFIDKKYDALNIYLSMCYYKEEFYDVALELVNNYLFTHKDSVVANNLKAAIEYNSTGNRKLSEAILINLQDLCKNGNILEDNDYLRHNMVVIKDGENALKVFSSLVDIIPEAKLNLIIYYLRNDQINNAYNIIKDMQPTSTKEYILKAVVHCLLGQQSEKNQEHLKKAQACFQTIGASPSECDTIEGRQCMASCFRLIGQHIDEIIYLESIETYLKEDDDFNWNYGIALGACQKYKEAEEVLLRINSDKYKIDQTYLSWLCRCYIMNGKPEYAWNIYLSLENHINALFILNLIAHDCYRTGNFFFSFKAFAYLDKFSPSIENMNGKFASAVGVFYQVVSGKFSSEKLQEVIHNLVSTQTLTQSEEVKKIIKVFKKWGKENNYNFTDAEPMYENPY